MVGPGNSAKIGADYVPAQKDGKAFLEASGSFVSKAGETADRRLETFNESAGWYEAFVADMFAKTAETAGKP